MLTTVFGSPFLQAKAYTVLLEDHSDGEGWKGLLVCWNIPLRQRNPDVSYKAVCDFNLKTDYIYDLLELYT